MKTCTKCNLKKELADFSKCKKHLDGLRYECKACQKLDTIKYRKKKSVKKRRAEKEREYRKKDPLNNKDIHLRSKYGISINDYNKMYTKQSGCCKICGVHQSDLKKSLCVDHCHDTLNIRGLLCDKCNRVLGVIKDSVEMCDKLKKYLIESAKHPYKKGQNSQEL